MPGSRGVGGGGWSLLGWREVGGSRLVPLSCSRPTGGGFADISAGSSRPTGATRGPTATVSPDPAWPPAPRSGSSLAPRLGSRLAPGPVAPAGAASGTSCLAPPGGPSGPGPRPLPRSCAGSAASSRSGLASTVGAGVGSGLAGAGAGRSAPVAGGVGRTGGGCPPPGGSGSALRSAGAATASGAARSPSGAGGREVPSRSRSAVCSRLELGEGSPAPCCPASGAGEDAGEPGSSGPGSDAPGPDDASDPGGSAGSGRSGSRRPGRGVGSVVWSTQAPSCGPRTGVGPSISRRGRFRDRLPPTCDGALPPAAAEG